MNFNKEKILAKMPYIKMLILFGSRVKNEIHNKSDWDFAVLLDEKIRENNVFIKIEIAENLANLLKVNSEDIDVIIINNLYAPLLTHNIANDGKLILESQSGMFINFQTKYLLSKEKLTLIENEFKQNINNFLKEYKQLAINN